VSKVIKIDPEARGGCQQDLADVSDVVRNKGLIVFPSDTCYGLGCNGLDESAIQRVFELKKRPPHHPLLLLIPCLEDLPSLVTAIPSIARKLIRALWPGPLTLVFKASDKVPRLLTGGTGKIGIRIPGCAFTREMIACVGRPLVGTSANISGRSGALDVTKIRRDFGEGVDLYLDAGRLAQGKPSTVVDVTGKKSLVVREGRVANIDIENL